MTNAELAARLLREAAGFYRLMGNGGDQAMAEQVERFGRLYEQVADRLEADPGGEVDPAIVS